MAFEQLHIEGCDTLTVLFLKRVADQPDRITLREREFGVCYPVTWSDYGEQARLCGLSRMTLGMQPREVCSVASEVRRHWMFADLGIIFAGGVTNGIYPTDSPAQVEYLINDSGTRFAYERAMALGKRVSNFWFEGTRPSLWLRLGHWVLDRLVLKNICVLFGIDRARWLSTAAAPIAPDLIDFDINWCHTDDGDEKEEVVLQSWPARVTTTTATAAGATQSTGRAFIYPVDNDMEAPDTVSLSVDVASVAEDGCVSPMTATVSPASPEAFTVTLSAASRRRV